MTLIDLRVSGPANVCKGFVVGYRDPDQSLVKHVAISVSDGTVGVDGETTVVHMVPRYNVESVALRIDVLASTEWLPKADVDDLLGLAYALMPPNASYSRTAEVPPRQAPDGRMISPRYSCSGFVRKVFRDLGIDLLASPLPVPPEGVLDAFRVPANERLSGEALLPGYIVHACAAPTHPHATASGEAFVPARSERDR